MPVQIHINGETATEAIQELAILASHLASSTTASTTITVTPPERSTRPSRTKPPQPAKEETAETKSEEEPVNEPDQDEAQEPQDDGAPIPTVVELRAKAQEVGTTPEAKKAIKALLDEFGSKSISDVPEDKRIEFLARLEELA